MSPADIHALSMVAILGFALGSILTLFLIMARNAKKSRDLPEIPELEDPQASQKALGTSQNGEQAAAQPWEKESDWWKKS